MTTIAYHHESRRIAVDGRVTAGDLIASSAFEKWRIVGEEVWFLSGAVADFDRFIAYHQKEMSGFPEYSISCSALVASGGACYEAGVTKEGEPWRSIAPYSIAMGSGRDFAIGAMDHGKDAYGAVSYASNRDTGTGGKITVFDLATMSFVGGDNV